MNKAFEKILERFDEECISPIYYPGYAIDLEKANEIVKEVAEEYKGGCIPCSERLPEEAFGCLVTVMDSDPVTLTDFENILPYSVGYDGHGWNDINGETISFEVIAWMPLPECWKEEKYKE